MAEIQIFCTHCEYRFTLPASLAGSTQICPHCKKEFTVLAAPIPPMEQTTNRGAAIAAAIILLLLFFLFIYAVVSGDKQEPDPAEMMPVSSEVQP